MTSLDRRGLLRLGGALTVGAGLAACSGTGNSTDGGGAGDSRKGEITVWSWQGPAAQLKALLPEFNKAYPDIKVTVQDIGNPAIWDKITTGMAAGGSGLADVLHIGVDYLPGYVEKFPTGLADLGPLGATKHKDAFAQGLWQTVAPKGRVNALPWEANSGGFYYRADLFEQAGVDVESLQTWDEVIEAGKKLKAATGAHLLGIDKPASQPDAANFFQLLLQLQGKFYFDLDGAITLDSPEAVTALTLIKKMNDAGLVSDLSGGWSALENSIKQGTAAVLPWPTWFGGIIESLVPQEAGKWKVRLPPAVRRGGATAATVNSTHLAVAGSSKQQAAAWTFIEYVLTKPSSQVAIYRGKGIAPALMAAYEDSVFHEPSAFFSGQKKGEIFLAALKAPSPAFNYSADYARALKVVTDAQTKVLLKGADPAEVLKQAADQLAQQTGRKVVR
ncbi:MULTISPECIES: ABC transporter substrate-binding protein [unclassified Kitasatospora]|uniref:ABC transporter substrate-binding protein n=1 Tax=unclassified Kitasatospora TaxID=2633591 RepID=UPI00070D19D9|nr:MULTISPECIES: sugar ABC transporter substrate-binding protein [unclassified Kitasatospora]KQV24176.1 ABC transporter substrate-binding protein [Kitasatospora sp. Root107]KRB67110.1 ABC transporter substrate-binding protein [Kitasatospora sp. Root187]